MKKLIGMMAIVAVAFAFTACDGAKKAAEAKDKAMADSTRVADSVAAVVAKAEQDMVAAKAKFKADSTRVADSLAAAATVTKKK